MLRLMLRCGFGAICFVCAWMPFVRNDAETTAFAVPRWPAEWEGQPLYEVPLSAREITFTRSFPGTIAKFTDGRRDLILRWVTQGTRRLHSSSDCFRGLGYSVRPEPAMLDARGARWSCFSAQRGRLRLHVRERITDQHGGEWTDASAWFWSSMLRQTTGPWLAATVVENGDSDRQGAPE